MLLARNLRAKSTQQSRQVRLRRLGYLIVLPDAGLTIVIRAALSLSPNDARAFVLPSPWLTYFVSILNLSDTPGTPACQNVPFVHWPVAGSSQMDTSSSTVRAASHGLIPPESRHPFLP